MQGGEFVVSLLQVEIAGGLGPGEMKKKTKQDACRFFSPDIDPKERDRPICRQQLYNMCIVISPSQLLSL